MSRLHSIALAVFLIGGTRATAAPVSTDDVLPTAPQDAAQTEYKEVKDALEKFKNRDADGALVLLNQAHTKYPELPPGPILLAKMFFDSMKGTNQANQAALLQYARATLERAVAENPEDPDAFLYFGDLAFAQGRITEAELLFGEAAALTDAMPESNPRKPNLYKRCLAGAATMAETRQKLDEATAKLTELTKLDPQNALAHYRLGTVLFKEKKRQAAYGEFKEAAKLNAQLGPPEIVMLRLFEGLAQKGDADAAVKAEQMATYALSQGGTTAATQLGVARWRWDRDEVAKAKEHALKAQEIDASSLEAKLLLGLIARYEQDLPTAEKLFDEVYKAEPGNFAASNQLVITLADQDDTDKHQRALGIADTNFKQFQNTQTVATAAATLGWVYYRMNRPDDAEKYLQAAMQAGRGNISGDTAYYLSRLLADKNRVEDAKKILQTTLDGKGPFPYRGECQKLLAELDKRPPSTQ